MQRQETNGNGNCIRNTQLVAMLAAAEKAQSQRLKKSLKNFQESDFGRKEQPNTPMPKPRQEGNKENEIVTPAKTKEPVADACKFTTEAMPLTLDEEEWLDGAAKEYGHANLSGVISRLIDWANTEAPELKKKMFLVIRCRRCSAGAKGGVKRDRDIELSSQQWQWLENVRGRCKHASIGKTLRIIVDFYMPLCKDDSDFAQKVLRAGSNITRERHADAIKCVDPARALAIGKGFS